MAKTIWDAKGVTQPPNTLTMDRGRLRLFAKATGQTDRVYFDLEAAKAAGYPDLLVPPTFLFAVDLEQPDPFLFYKEHNVDMGKVLHGSQSFEYVAPVFAGDEIVSSRTVTDVYDKKGGALVFVEAVSTLTRGGETVAILTGTTVIRNA